MAPGRKRADADTLQQSERLDRLENYGSHLAEQNDRLAARLEEVGGELRALIDRSWLELRAIGEAVDAAVERLDELRASGDSGVHLVEEAFALGALAGLPSGSRVLEVGGGGRLTASLGALGIGVTATGGLTDLDREGQDFDAALLRGPVERAELDRVAAVLGAGGRVVLSVPAGTDVDGLLQGWSIQDRRVARDSGISLAAATKPVR